MKKLFLCGALCLLLLFVSHAMGQGHSSEIQISIDPDDQGWIQCAYDLNNDEYLVVWEDYRVDTQGDIYGQFVDGDGTLINSNFVICGTAGAQYWPRLDFEPETGRFLVVFEDYRVFGTTGSDFGEVRGIFVQRNGTNVDFPDAPTSEADHSFVIRGNLQSKIYAPSVAFNFTDFTYLVVWGDSRNNQNNPYIGYDVYGQRISMFGELLSPPTPADPLVNFPIFDNPDVYQSIPDVSYSHIINEWLVVCGTSEGEIRGQRVNNLGQLISMDGTTILTKQTNSATVNYGFLIGTGFYNGPDCLQARCAFNTEFSWSLLKNAAIDWCECEVIWKGNIEMMGDNDLYGQRIGFFEENQVIAAKYVDVLGDDTSPNLSRHTICDAPDWVGPADLAYGAYDNEFLVGWGDEREGRSDQDLYCQRLWVNSTTQDMIWLADDRVNTVASDVNIPVATTTNYEGSLLGVAHSLTQNEFFMAFTFEDISQSREGDVYGYRFFGTPTGVKETKGKIPTNFAVEKNYPNPFNPETKIHFAIPKVGRVSITIYDLIGRRIQSLIDENYPVGEHAVNWHGKDYSGNNVASGIYIYEVQFDEKVRHNKMTLIR